VTRKIHYLDQELAN